MGRDPRVLQEELQAASGNIVLKILPSYHEAIMPRQVTQMLHQLLCWWCCALGSVQMIINGLVLQKRGKKSQTSVFAQVFFKCHYDYDPANDNLIPCKEAGLRFETGDILQIVNQDDVNWWQVKCRSSISSPLCEVSQKRQCILKWRSHWVFSRDLCVFSNILDILSVCLCYLGSSCGGWKHRTDPKSDAWGEEESLCKERCGADTHR